MSIPYKVKINKDGSYEYFDLNGNPVTQDGKQEDSISKTLPEIEVTAKMPKKSSGLGLLDPQVYLKDLPKAYETLYNNYTAKGLSLPAEYTSFREMNDELAKTIGDAALTYVGGQALKPLGAVVKSAFPVISKFTNPKILKHTLSKVPQRFTNAIKNFNLKDSANDFLFNHILSKPISKLQFAGDVAAGMAMNHYVNKPIHNNQSIVDMLSDASHFNPTITSGILDMAAGAAWEKQVSQRFRDTAKRAVETVMRSNSNPNPLSGAIDFRGWRNWPGESHRYNRNNTIKYILTGKGYKPLVGFNVLHGNFLTLDDLKNYVYNHPSYTGIYSNNSNSPFYVPIRYDEGYGDVIDASLYGTPIDSKIVKQVNTDDFGIHTTYVRDYYPEKVDDIKVYTGTPKTIDVQLPPISKLSGFDGSMSALSYPIEINTAGHMIIEHNSPYPNGSYSTFKRVRNFNGDLETKIIQTAPRPDRFEVKQDIWKFNPGDYSKKWSVRDVIGKLGLNIVDDLTTPIIFRNVYSN